MEKPNIVLIMSDTFRKDSLETDSIKTPNLDAFSSESFVFENAYPESLPTIPVRRAIHTGTRAFPFDNYNPVKWDIVYLPGWQPITNSKDTIAEQLAYAGYHTGFVTDTLPYFAPGFNFTRGFWQWEFIRGQQQDRWQSPRAVSDKDLEMYTKPNNQIDQYSTLRYHVANTKDMKKPDQTTTSRVFDWAMKFLEDNKDAEPFYLLVDCFDPHEPWEAPDFFYNLYKPKEYKGKTIIHTKYGPIGNSYSNLEIANIIAHYRGLTTLVDDYVGKFLNKLKGLGLWENTLVIFTSDHGTNFGNNSRKIIGKPSYAMFPPVMDLPLIMKLPGYENQNLSKIYDFVYNIDISATIRKVAGIKAKISSSQGQSLLELTKDGESSWRRREYLTCRYGDHLWYRDDRLWMIFSVYGIPLDVYYLQEDPSCNNNKVVNVEEHDADLAWNRILHDAGGQIPVYDKKFRTDAIGQK